MTISSTGELLVVESGAGRLTGIVPGTGATRTVASGLELGHQFSAGTSPSDLPTGVAVGAAGAIYVTGDEANVVYAIAGRAAGPGDR
jgi:hypothetical protein